jgi:ribosomal protein S8
VVDDHRARKFLGVLSDRECRRLKMGGEVLCSVA